MVTEEYVKRLIGRLLNYPWQEIELTPEPKIIYWRTERPYRAEISQKPHKYPCVVIYLDLVGRLLWKEFNLTNELVPLISFPTFSGGTESIFAAVLTPDLNLVRVRLEKVLRKLSEALEKLSNLSIDDLRIKLMAEVIKGGEERGG